MQLSVAVGLPNVTTEEHSPGSTVRVTLGGHDVITGRSESITTIVKEQDAPLFAASVAPKTTSDVPILKNEPDAGPNLVMVGEAVQLSDAVALLYVTFAPHCPAALNMVRGAGQLIDGACVSLTVTVKEQDAALDDASVALKVTIVEPTLKNEPDAGPKLVMVGEVVQLSVAVAFPKVTYAPHSPGSFATVTGAGQVIVGFTRSRESNTQLEQPVAMLAPRLGITTQVCGLDPTVMV